MEEANDPAEKAKWENKLIDLENDMRGIENKRSDLEL